MVIAFVYTYTCLNPRPRNCMESFGKQKEEHHLGSQLTNNTTKLLVQKYSEVSFFGVKDGKFVLDNSEEHGHRVNLAVGKNVKQTEWMSPLPEGTTIRRFVLKKTV